MALGDTRNGGASRQSYLQPSSSQAATTSESAADRGHHNNLTAIRRQKKREKEKARKKRRGAARREPADDMQAGAGIINPQVLADSASATFTKEDAGAHPCGAEHTSMESSAAQEHRMATTDIVVADATDIVVTDEVRGPQPHKSEETVADGAKTEPGSNEAASVAISNATEEEDAATETSVQAEDSEDAVAGGVVTKPRNQVAVLVAKPHASLFVQKESTEEEDATTTETKQQADESEATVVDGLEAPITQERVAGAEPVSSQAEVTVRGAVDMVVARAVAARLSSETKTTVGGDNADNLYLLVREQLSRQRRTAKHLDRKHVATAAEAAGIAAEEAAVAAAVAVEAAAVAAATETEVAELGEKALEVVAVVVVPSSSPPSSSPSSPSSSSSSATAATVGDDDAEQQALTRERRLSKQARACEGLDGWGKIVTTTEAAENAAGEAAAAAAVAARAAAAAAAAAEAVVRAVEVKKEVMERTALEERLKNAVNTDLNNRDKEAAFTKDNIKVVNLDRVGSFKNGLASRQTSDDGSSHTDSCGSTYKGEGSDSSEDGGGSERFNTSEEGRHGLSSSLSASAPCFTPVLSVKQVMEVENIGGTWYPAVSQPMQLQQGNQCWGGAVNSVGAHPIEAQYVPRNEMEFDANVSGACYQYVPEPMMQQQQQQQQQTSEGVHLANAGGTWYPVASPPLQDGFEFADNGVGGMCYSSKYMQPRALLEYGEIGAACIRPRQTDYVQPQSVSFENDFRGEGCPTMDLPIAQHLRTMTYGGRTYPYWMP